jgi:hypothetical protein
MEENLSLGSSANPKPAAPAAAPLLQPTNLGQNKRGMSLFVPATFSLGSAASAASAAPASGKPFQAPSLAGGWMQSRADSLPPGVLPPIPPVAVSLSVSRQGEHPGLLRRVVGLPVRFSTWDEYLRSWSGALEEAMQLAIDDAVIRYRRHLVALAPTVMPGAVAKAEKRCPHGPVRLGVSSKPGPNQGRCYYMCRRPPCDFFEWAEASDGDSEAVVAKLRAANLPLVDRGSTMKLQGSLRRAGAPAYLCAGVGLARGAKLRLELGSENKEHSSAYSRDDVWVVSTHALLERAAHGYIAVARSVYHGPSSSGSMELQVVASAGAIPPGEKSLFALRAVNLASEFVELAGLQDTRAAEFLLLPSLLHGTGGPAAASVRTLLPGSASGPMFGRGALPAEATAAARAAAVSRFRLNDDQLRLVDRALTWSEAPSEEGRILLLRGTFGSGKSCTLVSLLMALVAQFEAAGRADDCRILVCCATNHAVDRVLCELEHQGFTRFVRVGSVRRMAGEVLPYAVGNLDVAAAASSSTAPGEPAAPDASSSAETLKELRERLKEASSPREIRLVQTAIAEVRSGVMHRRAQQVKAVPIVGATISAATFPVFKGCRFGLVVVDECTQMTETASVIPLTRFRAERVILSGDPRQLPPVMPFEGASPGGLDRTLFDRMLLAGAPTVDLRWQYRCHPAISAIANRMFYGGSLIDGVDAEQRGPLAPMPVAWVMDVDHGSGEVPHPGGSLSNQAEAEAMAHLVRLLLEAGVRAGQIGIISLYRAQVDALKAAIERVVPQAAQAATGKRRRKAARPTTATGKKKKKAKVAPENENENENEDEGEDEGEDEDEDGSSSKSGGSRQQRDEGADEADAGELGDEEGAAALNADEGDGVEIATVDSYQGREKEIILLSMVKSSPSPGAADFSEDPRRANVALTRAKRHFVLCGHYSALSSGPTWGGIARAIRDSGGPGWKVPSSEVHTASSLAGLFRVNEGGN